MSLDRPKNSREEQNCVMFHVEHQSGEEVVAEIEIEIGNAFC